MRLRDTHVITQAQKLITKYKAAVDVKVDVEKSMKSKKQQAKKVMLTKGRKA